MWCEVRAQLHSFVVDIQLSQHYLLKKLLHGLGTLVKNQSTIHRRVYFWTLKSTALIYISGEPPPSLTVYRLCPSALGSPGNSHKKR